MTTTLTIDLVQPWRPGSAVPEDLWSIGWKTWVDGCKYGNFVLLAEKPGIRMLASLRRTLLKHAQDSVDGMWPGRFRAIWRG